MGLEDTQDWRQVPRRPCLGDTGLPTTAGPPPQPPRVAGHRDTAGAVTAHHRTPQSLVALAGGEAALDTGAAIPGVW